MSERSTHLIVTGRVQGVGYRAFVAREAERRGLAGWVRNRGDGSVEAVFVGPDADVEAMLAVCWKGPGAAEVTDISVGDYVGPPLTRFTMLPTA